MWNSEPDFTKDTDVIRHRTFRSRHVQWILLPVYAWRVLAPVRRQRRLNVFQRAVLGLARAGVVQVHRVSKALLIHEDLAAVVAQELQSRGYMDLLGRPTTRGLEALEDLDTPSDDELVSGFVFTSATNGEVWPTFLEGHLELAEVEPDDQGWPKMLSGSVGDPWQDRAFALLPRAHEVDRTRPKPAEVVRASQRQGQRLKRLSEDAEEASLLGKVDFIEDEPQPYLMAVSARSVEDGGWRAEDPFDGQPSPALTEQVEHLLDEHPALRNWLSRLMSNNSEEATIGALQEQAAWEVESRLTLSIRGYTALYDRLVAMQRSWLEIQGSDVPRDKLDDVVVKAQKAIERLLCEVHGQYSGHRPPYYEELTWQKESSSEAVDRAARAVGFPTPLPETLSYVRRGKVQFAEQSGHGSLRPMLIVALLAAKWNEDHPLRAAAPRRPNLLVELDRLAGARDQAAHEGRQTKQDRIGSHLETVFAAVELLALCAHIDSENL